MSSPSLLDVLSDNNTVLVFDGKEQETIDSVFGLKGVFGKKQDKKYSIESNTLKMNIQSLKEYITASKTVVAHFKVQYYVDNKNATLYLDINNGQHMLNILKIIQSGSEFKLVDSLHEFMTNFKGKLTPAHGGASQAIFMSIMNATRQIMKDAKGTYVTIDGKRQYLNDLREYTVFSMRII